MGLRQTMQDTELIPLGIREDGPRLLTLPDVHVLRAEIEEMLRGW